MILTGILGGLAALSCGLQLWQWVAARRFPLHQRVQDEGNAPAVTLLKPIKGCDQHTEDCLRSWFAQEYRGDIQILFAVAEAGDPVVAVIAKLRNEFPQRDAQLVVCPERLGANAKVSKLAQLEAHVKYELVVVSDADVKVPPDLLANAVVPLRDSKVGLVNCFYRLANPTTLAMRLEAVAVNADFWSQVLQSKSLKPLDFALGAVMVTRRQQLAGIGGFRALADCLADDYQLGHRIAKLGYRIELCPVVVECWDSPMGWAAVGRHQLRWARTIRVCQPLPYFFSILSNATLWPMLWLVSLWPWMSGDSHRVAEGVFAGQYAIAPATFVAAVFVIVRIIFTGALQSRLTLSATKLTEAWLIVCKDLLQVGNWAAAFLGNTIEWRGERYRLQRDGTLKIISQMRK